MVESRWVRWIGPGVLALGAVGLDHVRDGLGAGDRPWVPRACAGPPRRPDRGRPRRRRGDGGVAARRRGSGWTRDSIDDGALARPAAGARPRSATRSQRPLDLPAESFAAGPFGRVVLVGSDDGTASRLAGDRRRERLRLDDRRRSATSSAARRSTPTGTPDLRDARRPIDAAPISASGGDRSTAASRARRVLAAARRRTIGSGGRSRRSSPGTSPGDRLAVQSCGEVACRTRVVAPAGGPDADRSTRRTSARLIGLDGDRVVTYLACRGPPLPHRRDGPADRRAARPRDERPGRRPWWPRRRRPARPRGRRPSPVAACARSTSTAAQPSTSARSRTACACTRPRPSPASAMRLPAGLGPARPGRPDAGRRPVRSARSSAASRTASPSRSMR